LNGIDQEVWNPETYKVLSANYFKINFEKGKLKNKELLWSQSVLDPIKLLLSFIGRLT